MLFNYPTFLNTIEQSKSDLLFNNIKICLQTSVREIWYDINFGTKIRSLIKGGIDDLTISEIKDDIEENLQNYFKDDIIIRYFDIYQEYDTIVVSLTYTELSTGKYNTVQAKESITNEE